MLNQWTAIKSMNRGDLNHMTGFPPKKMPRRLNEVTKSKYTCLFNNKITQQSLYTFANYLPS